MGRRCHRGQKIGKGKKREGEVVVLRCEEIG